MPYRLVLEIPAVPLLENAMSKRHWSVESRHRKKWRQLVAFGVGSRAPDKPLKCARVVIDVWRKGRKPDPVNLLHSMKPVIDGLQPMKRYMRRGKLVLQLGAGVIEDDQAENFEGGCYVVHWHKAARGESQRLRIVVEEAAADAPDPESDLCGSQYG